MFVCLFVCLFFLFFFFSIIETENKYQLSKVDKKCKPFLFCFVLFCFVLFCFVLICLFVCLFVCFFLSFFFFQFQRPNTVAILKAKDVTRDSTFMFLIFANDCTCVIVSQSQSALQLNNIVVVTHAYQFY